MNRYTSHNAQALLPIESKLSSWWTCNWSHAMMYAEALRINNAEQVLQIVMHHDI